MLFAITVICYRITKSYILFDYRFLSIGQSWLSSFASKMDKYEKNEAFSGSSGSESDDENNQITVDFGSHNDYLGK